MPFMPEMLQFAGKRLKVSASAHKGCDTIETYHNRRDRKFGPSGGSLRWQRPRGLPGGLYVVLEDSVAKAGRRSGATAWVDDKPTKRGRHIGYRSGNSSVWVRPE